MTTADRTLLTATRSTPPTSAARGSGRSAHCGHATRNHLFRLALRTPGLLLGDVTSHLEADVPGAVCESSAHRAACLVHARP